MQVHEDIELPAQIKRVHIVPLFILEVLVALVIHRLVGCQVPYGQVHHIEGEVSGDTEEEDADAGIDDIDNVPCLPSNAQCVQAQSHGHYAIHKHA